MGTAPIPTIPLTAWEQAVAVCLFILFGLFLVWLLLRYMLTHFGKIVDSIDKLVDKFLKATEFRDERFVESLDRRDTRFEGQTTLTLVELRAVQAKLDILNGTLIDHDAKTDQALADMRTAKAKRAAKTVPRSDA
jgi:hypothetical protein